MAGFGTSVTVNRSMLVADPAVATTVIGPVVAVGGIVASTESPNTLKSALTPPKRTAITFTKLFPSIVTDVPGGPFLGSNPVIVGGGTDVIVNTSALLSVPVGDTTAMGPVVALA